MSASARPGRGLAIAIGGTVLTWLVTIAVLFAVEDARHQGAALGWRIHHTAWWIAAPFFLTWASMVAGVVVALGDGHRPAAEPLAPGKADG